VTKCRASPTSLAVFDRSLRPGITSTPFPKSPPCRPSATSTAGACAGEHNRARDLLNRRIWPLAAVFVGSILLAFFIAWGRPFLSGTPFRTWTFTLDLQAHDALAMSTALLAVAGAVAIALAVLIRPEPTLPIRYEAARRWWTVGTLVILGCGIISVTVGVLEALTEHFLLAFGISSGRTNLACSLGGSDEILTRCSLDCRPNADVWAGDPRGVAASGCMRRHSPRSSRV
jgi:hypothetical protein